MKQILIDRYGPPHEIARCAEVADVGAPAAGEVVFDVLLFPINPADLLLCRGNYRLKPPLPATPGAECVGRVSAVGAGVTAVKSGDLVITLLRENWTQRRRVKAEHVIALPPGIDPQQAAMLRINPATALLLLTAVVPLTQGEWMIQNVANSSVGRLVIALARKRGIKTLNVVRREALFGELAALGADACVVDGPELATAVKTQTAGAPIRLGLDAVAGAATGRIASCLCEGGVVCAYGAMSGEDAIMPRSALSAGAVTLTGFTLTRPLSTYSREQVRAMYAELAQGVMDRTLHAPVEKIYPIEQIKDALLHAQRGERNGKILVAPNADH